MEYPDFLFAIFLKSLLSKAKSQFVDSILVYRSSVEIALPLILN